jgi:hypothetical protein
LKFTDGDRSLAFADGVFKIGDQTIGLTSTALTPSTVTISLDIGSDASRAALSGSSGAVIFTDNAAVAGNVRITGFGADDVKRAGLEALRLHDLRHSYASNLVNGGVSLYVVQQLLGHTNPQTTQRYAHLEQDTLARASEIAASAVQRAVDSDVETDRSD